MRRAGAAVGLAIAGLAAIVLVRTLAVGARRVARAPAAPPAARVDGAALAQRLAAGVRLRTVSHEEQGRVEADALRAFRELLAADYPRAHRALTRELVAGHSLLYTWPGRDPESPGVLLAAHQDVVPAPDGADWSHAPFAGDVADGAVWGRGAMDDKGSLFCLLEAVEGLVAEGFEPRRNVYLAFGHDEEVGGEQGARAIAALLAQRGVRLDLVLDEGGAVADGMVDLLPGPLALVGVAEKGSVSVLLRVEAQGGHSSVPPRHGAVGILAAAVRALEDHPMPARLALPTRRFLDRIAPELPFATRAVVANLWLSWPLLAAGSARVPALDAMLRTTTAATVFHSGVKANVLPREAEAIVNFRILPGDRVEDVLRHVRRTVDDERVQVSTTRVPREASPVSPTDSEAFASLQRVIAGSFPDALVAPYLVLGGTDARHYAGLSDHVYRFGPFRYGAEALKLAHGRDERISIDNLVQGVRFYRALLRELAASP